MPITCCGTADLNNTGQISFTDLLPSHALIIQLCQGFYILYTCLLNVSLHRIISINFPLIFAIWWTLTQCAIIFMHEWMTETRIFLYHRHTEENINTWTTSPELFWVTSWEFHLSKTILISYTHRKVKVSTATRQNKSLFFLSNQITFIVTSRALASEVGYEVGYETLLRTLQQKYLFRCTHYYYYNYENYF